MSEIARHWIDGGRTGSGAVSESLSPATGAVLGQWADGGEAEARAAIAAARRAFDNSPWSRDRILRHRALSEMADRFVARAGREGHLPAVPRGQLRHRGQLRKSGSWTVQTQAGAEPFEV